MLDVVVVDCCVGCVLSYVCGCHRSWMVWEEVTGREPVGCLSR